MQAVDLLIDEVVGIKFNDLTVGIKWRLYATVDVSDRCVDFRHQL